MNVKPWGTEWSEALSMSDPEIDAEHEQFDVLTDKLKGAMADLLHNQRELQQIMQRIVELAEVHFAHEECLYNEHAYPGRQEHGRIHTEIIDELNRAMQVFRDTDQMQRWTETARAVDRLLHEHMEIEDAKYIEYLQGG